MMDSLESLQPVSPQHEPEGSKVEDDFDNVNLDEGVEDDFDDDDIDDEEFCTNVLKPHCNEVFGGINLKDLCEGREVMFKMQGGLYTTDDEYIFEREIDADYDDEAVNCIYKSDFENIERQKEKQTNFRLNERFEILARRMTSITDDDRVKKEEIIAGIGKVIPGNSYAIVHYNLFKGTSDQPFDSTYLRNKPERINMGQTCLIPGLEIAIRSMRKRENSRFFIGWEYGFGALGCPDRIEPKCDIIADVTLLSFKEIDVIGLINDCGSWFERGVLKIKVEQSGASDCFKEGKTKQAISKYKRSVRMINNLGIAGDRDEIIYYDLKVKSVVNLAICYNKLGLHELASVMCQEALSISPNNTKALFHYARASIALSNFTKARNLLTKLNRMCPRSRDVVDEMRKLDQKKEAYNVTTQSFWKKALMGLPGKKNGEAREQGSNSLCDNWSDGSNSPSNHLEDPLEDEDEDEEEEEMARRFERNMKLRFEEDHGRFLELE